MSKKRITAGQLVDWINDGEEVAIVDTREAGLFGEGHLFLAINVPFSRLEARLPDVVPRLGTRLVLIVEEHLEDAVLNAVAKLGYTNSTLLDDAASGWETLGYALFKGVNVPCKAFAEVVEHAYHTPSLEPAEFEALKASGAPVVLLDPRTKAEFEDFHVPGALHAPGAEIVARVQDLVQSGAETIVVSCAGRTRGIVGAQALINAGVSAPVYALSGGTQGWRLAGYNLDRGDRAQDYRPSAAATSTGERRAQLLIERYGVRLIDTATLDAFRGEAGRTTYVFDVRQPEERGGLAAYPIPAEGGQLVQSLDSWVGTLKARLVLTDSQPGLRAIITAHWLQQQGWDVYVLPEIIVGEETGIPDANATAGRLSGGDLRQWHLEGARVLYAGSSAAYLAAHPEGVPWANRSRPHVWQSLAQGKERVIVVGNSPEADILAADLVNSGVEAGVFAGDWREEGLVPASGGLTDADRIDYLFWLHDRHTGNAAASRAYLDWELGLPDAIRRAGPVPFRLAAPETAG